jgi:hypothetical protein
VAKPPGADFSKIQQPGLKMALGNGKNTCLYHVAVRAELRKFQRGSQFPDPSSQFSVVRREGSWRLAFALQISYGGSRRLAREKNKKRSPEAGCRGMRRDMAGWGFAWFACPPKAG